MHLPTRVRSISLSTWRGIALAALVLLSFLPSRLKVALHTRGCLHDWAHLYAFAGLALLLSKGRRTQRSRVVALLKLFALGVLIEALQAHLRWRCLELPDICTDLVGVSLGALAGYLLRVPTSPDRAVNAVLRPGEA